jgi:hypothetical protein
MYIKDIQVCRGRMCFVFNSVISPSYIVVHFIDNQ